MKLIIYLYRFFLPLIILFTISSPVYSGKKNTDEKKEIRFWHSTGIYNREIVNSSISQFNESNQLITVIGEFQGNEKDLYLKLFSQENLPDIVHIPIQFLPALQEKKLLVDLTSLISKELRDDISERFWKSVSIKDRIYAIPFLYNVNILFVNQHILRISGVKEEEVPENWNDILAVSEKINRYSQKKWALYIPMNTLQDFISFVESYTGKPVIENEKITIYTDEIISAMNFLQDLVYQFRFMPAKISVDEGENLFLSGNLGILFASSSMLVYTESNLPYDMNVWHLPSHKNIVPVVSGSCLGLLKSNTKKEREAFKFIEYLQNLRMQSNGIHILEILQFAQV